jgi:hypothetical protein
MCSLIRNHCRRLLRQDQSIDRRILTSFSSCLPEARSEHATEHAAADDDGLLFFQKQTELSSGSVPNSLRGSIEYMRLPSGGKTEFESRTGAVATRAYYRERGLAPSDRDAEDERGRAGTNSQKYSQVFIIAPLLGH